MGSSMVSRMLCKKAGRLSCEELCLEHRSWAASSGVHSTHYKCSRGGSWSFVGLSPDCLNSGRTQLKTGNILKTKHQFMESEAWNAVRLEEKWGGGWPHLHALPPLSSLFISVFFKVFTDRLQKGPKEVNRKRGRVSTG